MAKKLTESQKRANELAWEKKTANDEFDPEFIMSLLPHAKTEKDREWLRSLLPKKKAARRTRRPARKAIAGRSRAGIEKCAGILKSGPRRGKLKKGYKFVEGKKCPVKG